MGYGEITRMATGATLETEMEHLANGIIDSLKERIGDEHEFIVHVLANDRDGGTLYCTGAALKDPTELPFHIYRAFVAITNEETRKFLRDVLADA